MADELSGQRSSEALPNGVRKAQIAEFWTWFAQHESDLARARPDGSPVLDELLQGLQGIDSNLFFEICTDSNPHELVVRAEGRRELFPLVDAVVAAAPRLEGWVFTALKPAMGFGFQTSYEGTSFDPRYLFSGLGVPAPSGAGWRAGMGTASRLQSICASRGRGSSPRCRAVHRIESSTSRVLAPFGLR